MAVTFVVHYSEVALKGKNRPEFVRLLRHNVSKALWGMSPQVSSSDGRLFVNSEGDAREVAARLSRVFGVAWFSEAKMAGRSYAQILESMLEGSRGSTGRTFKIDARRSDKSFPLTSGELAAKLGSEVVEQTGMAVDLNQPELTLHVDITRNNAIVYGEKTRGPGGLPLGSAGKVLHLFSGGIDSPVAAWLLMKRGCRPVYIHFYLAPTPEYAVNSKVVKELKALSLFGGKSTMILVPFAEYQAATLGRAGELEPSLFRRFMRMTAEALAPRFGAIAVSTGDSLSQAASQTLWNIANFDDGSSLPVLRPLLTYDKEEIISMAKRIGTYETSLEDYRDCCAIVTKHPKTRVPPGLITDLAQDLDFGDLAAKSIDAGTLVSYTPEKGLLKTGPLSVGAEGGSTEPMTSQRPMRRPEG